MKGIVFTEFIEMVENQFGYATMDKIISEANLPNNGAYTSVGTYPHQEMVALLMGLHKNTGIELNTLLKTFGHHLFTEFTKSYSVFFEKYHTAFEMLENIENHIHVEVKKLYPDAELPRFDTLRLDDHRLKMVYQSDRRMAALAEGLIESTIQHFKQTGTVEMIDSSEDGKSVTFMVTVD